jgi:hypothetical protein
VVAILVELNTSCPFLFYFWWDWVWIQGFVLAKQALYSLNHTSSPFRSHYFGNGVLQTICLQWSQTIILLISASQVATITGVSYQPPAWLPLFKRVWSSLVLNNPHYYLLLPHCWQGKSVIINSHTWIVFLVEHYFSESVTLYEVKKWKVDQDGHLFQENRSEHIISSWASLWNTCSKHCEELIKWTRRGGGKESIENSTCVTLTVWLMQGSANSSVRPESGVSMMLKS